MLDKRQILRQFDRSAERYERFDRLQRDMTDELLNWLPQGRQVLDLGCGNGRALQKLGEQLPDSFRLGLDLSASMLHQARERGCPPQAVQADMEALPLADASFDLVFCSAALQWTRPQLSLAEISRVLQPGGTLLLATLVEGSLAEWHRAWQMAGSAERVHRFPPAASICTLVEEQGLVIREQRQTSYNFDFPSPEAMLKDLKGLGGTHAAGNRSRGLLGKQTYARFRQAMLGIGCVARYQVLFVRAEKP